LPRCSQAGRILKWGNMYWRAQSGLQRPMTERYRSMFRKRYMKGMRTDVEIVDGIAHSGTGMTPEFLSYTTWKNMRRADQI